MTEEDIPKIMDLRKQMGMFSVATILQSWLKIDPEGAKVGVNENGDIIGACCCFKNHPELYFSGMYFVLEKYRRQNIGSQIFNAAMKNAKDKNIGANSILPMENIRNRGHFLFTHEDFKILTNYIPHTVNSDVLCNKKLPPHVEIEPFQDCLLPSMIQYDASVTGFKRERNLELSCKEMDSRTFVTFRNGNCIGFGSIKRTSLGTGIVAPLYADHPAVAEALLKKLVESYPNTKGFNMTTLASNISANSILQKLGKAGTVVCHRLYSKQMVAVNAKRIYALFDMSFSVI